ncbi:hypothetical protein FH972_021714 [Carpinus fangiana]|uniref:Flavin-containing monooxygenase n=1 Tax=Carpinus fangiana TaxID=176857 RepID=A0A5N6KQQ4_9ROSI|nr:hypothetical protein FH972_021714 [Carpinus fangiana]
MWLFSSLSRKLAELHHHHPPAMPKYDDDKAESAHLLSSEEQTAFGGNTVEFRLEKDPEATASTRAGSWFSSLYTRPIRARTAPTRAARSILYRISIILLPSFLADRFNGKQDKAPAKLRPTAFLDGMRGLAAWFVFNTHLSSVISKTTGSAWGHDPSTYHFLQLPIVRLIYGGHSSVCMFFVISGFALSIGPVHKMNKNPLDHASAFRSLCSSTFRRPARLFIPAVVSTIIVFILIRFDHFNRVHALIVDESILQGWPWHDAYPDRMDSFWAQLHDLWQKDIKMTQIFNNYVGDAFRNPYNGVLWTISLEFRASLMLFLTHAALFYIHRPVRIILIAGLIVLSILAKSFEMPLFFAGYLIAECWQAPAPASPALPISGSAPAGGRRYNALAQIVYWILFVSGAFLASISLYEPWKTPAFAWLQKYTPFGYLWSYFWISLGSVLLVLCAGKIPLVTAFFSSAPIRYLGKISFSLYLVHIWLVRGLGALIFYRVWQATGQDNDVVVFMGFLIAYTLLLTLVISAADLFWRMVENPTVDFAKWIEGIDGLLRSIMASAKSPNGFYPGSISNVNGYDSTAVQYVPVVIVGAGESGIAMGCRLKEKLGFDQFRIYDRQAGIGGTWWINRYPGVACDVPAVFYSFSFAPNPKWSSFHPPGAELVKYMNDVCSKFKITDKIQCNTDVEGCTWLEDEKIWEVRLRHMMPGTGDLSVKDRNTRIEKDGEQSVFIKRETIRAKVVISCVGGLVEPNAAPKNIPGWESFKGEVFHSARWKYDVDLKDKNVVVVGTGCSAAQFVPRLAKDYGAKSVTQVMRTPPWVVPRVIPPGGEEWWSANAPTLFSNAPGLLKALRTIIFCVAETDFFRLFGGDEKHARSRAHLEEKLLRSMRKKVPEKYHEILTPNYGVGCKRRIFDANWLEGLQDERIELTTQPLTQVNEHSVTIGPGQTYPSASSEAGPAAREVQADVIVLANGFETTRWLHPLAVTGRNGVDLVEQMEQRGGPQLYQGTAMDAFPNFFAIFGPNTAVSHASDARKTRSSTNRTHQTGHSSVILASENMVEYSLKFIEPLLNGDASTVEVKREAEEAYTKDIQKSLKKMVWASGGCQSWYITNDWNGTVYPYSQIWFTLRCMFPIWSHWKIAYTLKGQVKRQFAQILKVIAAAVAIIGYRNMRESGDGLEYFKDLAVRYLLIARMKWKSRMR